VKVHEVSTRWLTGEIEFLGGGQRWKMKWKLEGVNEEIHRAVWLFVALEKRNLWLDLCCEYNKMAVGFSACILEAKTVTSLGCDFISISKHR
jgi:hypothetical protein